MELEKSATVVVLDTSAIIHVASFVLRPSGRYIERFRTEAAVQFGPNAQFVFHPITLSELATNTHEEVLQSKARSSRSSSAYHAQRAKVNRYALIALKAIVEGSNGDGAPEFPFRANPLPPVWDDWSRVATQRADFRMLRCTKKSGVIPIANMADHLILGLALSLRADGYLTGFVSGDRELLGAACALKVPFLYSHVLDQRDGFAWKDCGRDESCIAGCSDGVASCATMFVGP